MINKKLCVQLQLLIANSFGLLSDNPQYRHFFLSNLAVNVGFWIQNATQIWLVYDLTGSGSMLGILAICQFGPITIFGLFGGVISDMYDRRAAMLVTESALLLSTAILALLTLTGQVTLGVILAVAAVRSLIYCVNSPVKQTFALDLIGSRSVVNALALNSTSANLGRIIGPAMAGAMISSLGPGLCFAANALCNLGMVLTVLRIRSKANSQRKASSVLSPIAGLLEALAAIRADARLSILVGSLFCICFIPLSFATVLPVFVSQTLNRDSTVYGILFACIGVGTLAGSVIMASLLHVPLSILYGAAAGIGLSQLLLVFLSDVTASGLVLVFAGVCISIFLIGANSVLLSETEDGLRGRVSGLYVYIVAGAGPLGTAISGWLCEVGGANLAFATGGVISLVVAITGFFAYHVASTSG